jgi:hypothetical protein
MIRNLKINVAYDKILIYDEFNQPLYANSNVADYDIHPWHTITHKLLPEIENDLNIEFPYYIKGNEDNILMSKLYQFSSQNLEFILDNTFQNMVKNTVEYFCERNEKFIYPIVLYNNDLFFKYETIELNELVLNSIKNKMAKLVFIQPTEGFFGMDDNEFIWLSNLSKKYSFDYDDVIVITANMKAKENQGKLIESNLISHNFTIHLYSYFEHNIWFHNGYKLNVHVKKSLSDVFNTMLNSNRTKKKNVHFLNFNRVPKLHRMILYGIFNTVDELKGKSITTLGGSPECPEDEYWKILNRMLPDDFNYNKQRILDFYEKYNSKNHAIYDEPDLENNKANVFNKEAHGRSFLNVISESLIDSTTIFFSEKTYKPILGCQPFIMCGNPHSLKNLKECGYMTFDKWWDESYDDEIDFIKRMEKIIDVLVEISKWDFEKCFQVTQEMESVLIHNFEKFISDKDIEETFDILSFNDVDNKTLI